MGQDTLTGDRLNGLDRRNEMNFLNLLSFHRSLPSAHNSECTELVAEPSTILAVVQPTVCEELVRTISAPKMAKAAWTVLGHFSDSTDQLPIHRMGDV